MEKQKIDRQLRMDRCYRTSYLSMLRYYEKTQGIPVGKYHEDMPLEELKQVHDKARDESDEREKKEEKKNQLRKMNTIKLTIKEFLDENFDEIFDQYAEQILTLYNEKVKEIDYDN
jgi:hypothetical protein